MLRYAVSSGRGFFDAEETEVACRWAVVEIDRLRAALREIQDREWVENALDPQWAATIAKEALDV